MVKRYDRLRHHRNLVRDNKFDTKPLESLNYNQPAESPNENIVIIQEMQGLAFEITNAISRLVPTNTRQKSTKATAYKEINLYETTTLHELQQAFE